jgi:hypothetical protein
VLRTCTRARVSRFRAPARLPALCGRDAHALLLLLAQAGP